MPRTYTTRDGDMWDWISFRLYGSEYHVDDLIDNNPLYYDVHRFTDGAVLNVPDLPAPAVTGFPPWVAIGTG